jgi:hypothetical protein
LSVGSPGSADGLRLAGVGVGVTSTAGVGAGDESGVCGKACNPASGVETGDGAGACARIGHAEIAARHPIAIKRLLTGTNLLMGILVQ